MLYQHSSVFIVSFLYVSETAINIGYSCQLLTDDMEEVFIIDAEDPAEVKKQLDDALKHIDDVKKGVKDRVDAEVNKLCMWCQSLYHIYVVRNSWMRH